MSKLNFSVEEACHESTLSKSTLYRAMRAHSLPFHKVGRRTVIPAEGLKAFIAGEQSK